MLLHLKCATAATVLITCGLGKAYAGEEYVAKPLPAHEKAFTWKDYNAAHLRWFEKTFLENYEKCAEHSPRWDAQAKVFLKRYAQVMTPGNADRDKWAEIRKLGEEISRLGCADPRILYIRGNATGRLDGDSKAEPLVTKSLDLLQSSRYPRMYAFYAARKLHEFSQAANTNAQQIEERGRKKMTYLAQAAADKDFFDGNQRYYMEEVLSEWDRCRYPYERETLVRQVNETANADPWSKLMINGLSHVFKAWEGFGKELALAETSLTAAHALHPEFPEAAGSMIGVAMTRGDSAERLWFDRAVSAQFDYLPAYRGFLWALRPRWHGSHERMYRLGVDCLNTKRFDTEVPGIFIKAIWDIGSEMDDWRDAYRRPGVYEHLRTFFEGMLSEKTRADSRNYWKTAYAVSAWAAGKYDDAKRMFDELGKDVSLPAFTECGADPKCVIGEVHLRAMPSRVEFEKAESLYANSQSLDALPILGALKATARHDPEAVAFLQDRILVLRWKKAFHAGEWVDLMPRGEFAGWEKKGGEWSVEPDGALKGASSENDEYAMLLCKFRVDADYEIRGEADAIIKAGIVLGYSRRVAPMFATFVIDRYAKKAFLVNGLYTGDKLARPMENPGQNNRFFLRVARGRVTATVNDKPLFTEQQIDPDWWSPRDGLIGVAGSYYKCRGYTMIFRNLQIRRFVEETPKTDVKSAKPSGPADKPPS
jgi:hypothetical protein